MLCGWGCPGKVWWSVDDVQIWYRQWSADFSSRKCNFPRKNFPFEILFLENGGHSVYVSNNMSGVEMKKNSFKIGKVAEWSLQKWRNQVALNDTIKGIKKPRGK